MEHQRLGFCFGAMARFAATKDARRYTLRNCAKTFAGEIPETNVDRARDRR